MGLIVTAHKHPVPEQSDHEPLVKAHPDRDTLLLVADIVAEGEASSCRFMIRNLSPGGLLAQGDGALVTGARVSVTLRNIGTVQGKVAWAENGRYGIAFDREIDPQAVRAPVALATFLSDSLKLRARPAGA
jgi:hypothetical protein